MSSRAIKSDNSVACAKLRLYGLLRFSVWWLTLGIAHQRITPGTPRENGAAKRIHRWRKRRGVRLAQGTVHAQQRAFDLFRDE